MANANLYNNGDGIILRSKKLQRLIKVAFVSSLFTVLAIMPSIGVSAEDGLYVFSDISHLFDNILPAENSAVSESNSAALKGITVVDAGEIKSGQFFPVKVGEYLEAQGYVLSPDDRVSVDLDEYLTDGMEIKIDRVTYAYETRTAIIPYQIVENPIQTIPKGASRIVAYGENGTAEHKIKEMYVNGVKVDEFIVDTTVIQPAKDEVLDVGVGGVVTSKDGVTYNYSYYIDVVATAYCMGTRTATGERLRRGIVAVDKNVIPFHTKMFITGDTVEYGYGVAEDTGGAIKGNKIDLAYETYNECIQFGRRSMRVYILEE